MSNLRIMKTFFILTGAILLGFTLKPSTQKGKILPVYIEFADSALNNSDFMVTVRASFGTRKVKTISKEDLLAYIKSEATRVAEDFHRSGGNLGDFEQFKTYQRNNSQVVANSLKIKFTLDSNGILGDTIFWNSHAVPINFTKPPKKNVKFIVLDSSNAKTMLQMSQSIADSIIASNVLERDQ